MIIYINRLSGVKNLAHHLYLLLLSQSGAIKELFFSIKFIQQTIG